MTFFYDKFLAFVPQVDLTPPPSPPPPARPNQKLDTHRAYYDYTTLIECYVRDNKGPMDLSMYDAITVTIRPYGNRNYVRDYAGSSLRQITTLAGTQTVPGTVQFTVAANEHTPRLDRDLYRFDISSGGASVYRALLEIV